METLIGKADRVVQDRINTITKQQTDSETLINALREKFDAQAVEFAELKAQQAALEATSGLGGGSSSLVDMKPLVVFAVLGFSVRCNQR